MSLKDKGFIFGLGAFRRYEHHFDETIGHFEETLKPSEQAVKAVASREGWTDEQVSSIRIRTISEAELNHRWAVMLKYAHDVYVIEHGGESISIDKFEQLIDEAPQSDWDAVNNQFMDSYYLGNKMRVYFGIPEPPETKGKTKKKSSASAKQ